MTVTSEMDGVPGPGTVLLDKYRVERVLGQGGMGVVMAAWHTALDQRVALKFLVGEAIHKRDAVERFLREARAAVKLHSEHVAKVTDVGMLESGSPYMVMEFLEGRDLGDMLDEGETVPLTTAVDYVLQAIDAVAEAHARGIVHRDLKPSNLFVARRDDGGTIIKVLDFGISKADVFSDSSDKAALTRSSTVMGSPLYMSPEQFRSSKKVDWRTDIWALGVILYELVCHDVPFMGETVGEVFEAALSTEPADVCELRPDAPPGLAEIIARCLRKKPEERFADVAELARALGPFGSGEQERCVARAARLLAGKSLARLMVEGPPSSRNAMVVGERLPRIGTSKRAQSIPVVRHTSGGWGTSSSADTSRRPRWQMVLGLGAAAALFVGGITLVKVVDKTHDAVPAAAPPVTSEPAIEPPVAPEKAAVMAVASASPPLEAADAGPHLEKSTAPHLVHHNPHGSVAPNKGDANMSTTGGAGGGILDERH